MPTQAREGAPQRDDPYATMAKGYDAAIEPLVREVRAASMKMFPLQPGASVLDVGCGTGTHLGIYQKAGHKVFGIDLSLGMLSVAQLKLAERAGLCLGDATRMPFPDESFDLVQAMLALHEMPSSVRSLVVSEAGRVVKKEGRFLVIDYRVGSVQFPMGWVYKTVITLVENLVGSEHTRNYRNFMAAGGLLPFVEQNGLRLDRSSLVGGGTIGLYLLARSG